MSRKRLKDSHHEVMVLLNVGSRALAPTMSRREEAAEAWPEVDNIAFS